MRPKPFALAALSAVLLAFSEMPLAQEYGWEIHEEYDFSADDGSRSRIWLEIKTDSSSLSYDELVRFMMEAALQRHDQDRPDSILVTLMAPYGGIVRLPQNQIVYSPDGCDFIGKECTGESWVTPMHGTLPPVESEPELLPDLGVTAGDVAGLFYELEAALDVTAECDVDPGAGEGYPWRGECETPLALVEIIGTHGGDVATDDPIAKVSIVLVTLDNSAAAAIEIATVMIGMANLVMPEWEDFTPKFNRWITRKEDAEIFMDGKRVTFRATGFGTVVVVFEPV